MSWLWRLCRWLFGSGLRPRVAARAYREAQRLKNAPETSSPGHPKLERRGGARPVAQTPRKRLARIVVPTEVTALEAAREEALRHDLTVVEQPRGLTADLYFQTERELILAMEAPRENSGESLSTARDLDEAIRVSSALCLAASGCDNQVDLRWPAMHHTVPPERFLFSLIHGGRGWLVPRNLRFAVPGYADFSTAAACGHGHRIALARALAQFVQGCHDQELVLGRVTPSEFLFSSGYPPPVLVQPSAEVRRLGHEPSLSTSHGQGVTPVGDRLGLGPMILGLLADTHPDQWTIGGVDRRRRSAATRQRGPKTLLDHLAGRIVAGNGGVPQAGEWLGAIDEHEQG